MNLQSRTLAAPFMYSPDEAHTPCLGIMATPGHTARYLSLFCRSHSNKPEISFNPKPWSGNTMPTHRILPDKHLHPLVPRYQLSSRPSISDPRANYVQLAASNWPASNRHRPQFHDKVDEQLSCLSQAFWIRQTLHPSLHWSSIEIWMTSIRTSSGLVCSKLRGVLRHRVCIWMRHHPGNKA